MSESVQQRVRDLCVHFDCEDQEAVEAFVSQHPEVLPYLEQGPQEIEKFFPDSDLSLIVELDEDEENGVPPTEKLFLLIAVPGDLSDGLARLDKLDESWSINVCEETNELLVIDLSY